MSTSQFPEIDNLLTLCANVVVHDDLLTQVCLKSSKDWNEEFKRILDQERASIGVKDTEIYIVLSTGKGLSTPIYGFEISAFEVIFASPSVLAAQNHQQGKRPPLEKEYVQEYHGCSFELKHLLNVLSRTVHIAAASVRDIESACEWLKIDSKRVVGELNQVHDLGAIRMRKHQEALSRRLGYLQTLTIRLQEELLKRP